MTMAVPVLWMTLSRTSNAFISAELDSTSPPRNLYAVSRMTTSAPFVSTRFISRS